MKINFKYLGLQEAAFAKLGLNISNDLEKSFFQNRKIIALNIFAYIFTLVTVTWFMLRNHNNIDIIAESMIFIFSSVNSMSKLLILWKYASKFRKLRKQTEEFHKKSEKKNLSFSIELNRAVRDADFLDGFSGMVTANSKLLAVEIPENPGSRIVDRYFP